MQILSRKIDTRCYNNMVHVCGYWLLVTGADYIEGDTGFNEIGKHIAFDRRELF